LRRTLASARDGRLPSAPTWGRRPGGRTLLRGLLAIAWLASALPLQATTTFEDVGLQALLDLLGDRAPTGAGVPVSLVEAPTGTAQEIQDGLGRYFPDTLAEEYSLVTGVAKSFIDGSAKQGNGVSSHANGQATNIFGNTAGLAPGATQMTVYEANHYLTNVLRFRTNSVPLTQSFRVQNHSWVGSFADASGSQPHDPDPDNVRALQKFDYALDQANGGDGMTAVVGLNNNTNPIPYLMAHSYNAIAVGRTDGVHSAGLTPTAASSAYGPGRVKPDLVAPRSTTSAATSTVSGAVALLYEAVAGSDAESIETMKAIVLAGATKDEFLGQGGPGWSRTATQPLDLNFGAGELHVLNSYRIQLGGQFEPSEAIPVASAGLHGWDYQDRKSDATVGDLFYQFEIPDQHVAKEFSLILTWNHPGAINRGSTYNPAPDLKNLNLEFYDSTQDFLDVKLDESKSTVDNVEHLFFRDDPETSEFEGLLPGVYTLKVSGAAGWDYGLAWRSTTQMATYDPIAGELVALISADFDQSGVVDGADLLIWQRNQGLLVNATHAMGDADGDGDVDADDLLGFEVSYGPVPLASLRAWAVPEPAGWALAGWLASWCGLRRRTRR
jgi:hypothetical protein